MTARYHFVPWARRGVTTGITVVDPLDDSVPARVDLPVGLRVNDRLDVDVALRLHGPGDVTGIDERQVVRTDPSPGTTDFEPTYLVSLELDRPDFPWLFTPAAATGEGRLRPWVALVVVRRQPGVSVAFTPDRPLPVLTIDTPARPGDELPDLADAWAWCHAQVVTTPDGPTVETHLENDTPQSVSRLICPRRLEPGTRYLAGLVPAFAAGVASGLGQPLDDEALARLAPAWSNGAEAPGRIDLPLYHHWEFSTGAGGDFESLVRRLTGRPLPEGVGAAPLHADDAGLALPATGPLRFLGALTAPGTPAPPAPPDAFRTGVLALLDRAAGTAGGEADPEPLVAPPVYGSRHAARDRLPRNPGWLSELNLDPWTRGVAGLGTLVVQDQQEQLMAAAWDQLGEIAHERQVLDRPRFARTILDSIYRRRVRSLPVSQLLSLTAPAHARMTVAALDVVTGDASASPDASDTSGRSGQTVRHLLERGQLPRALTSATFRKAARPNGPLLRKQHRRETRPRTHGLAASGQVVLFEIARARPPRPVADSVTRQVVHSRVTRLRGTLAFSFPAGFPGIERERAELQRLIDSTDAVASYLDEVLGGRVLQARPGLALSTVQHRVLGRVDPRTPRPGRRLGIGPVSPAAATVSVTGVAAPPSDRPGAERPADTLATDAAADGESVVVHGPTFSAPMYEGLRDLSQELLLPGAERIPQDTVTLLETNARFVEAFLVGLNHEMSRELLWREYPSDERHTAFRRFWEGTDPDATDHGQIPPLHRWPDDARLGTQFLGGTADGRLVLLVRGQLLQRYPHTRFYAVRAQSRSALGDERRLPRFVGTLKPDMTFLGFDLTADEARGGAQDPGWFFVLEQPPTEPRFGLDAPVDFGRDPTVLGSWNDLAWSDLVETADELGALTHVPVTGRLAGKRIGPSAWGRNGAHMASITLQRPVRVALHAVDLLP